LALAFDPTENAGRYPFAGASWRELDFGAPKVYKKLETKDLRTPISVLLGIPLLFVAASADDRGQIGDLVRSRVASALAEAVPNWVQTRNCEVNSQDFYECQAFVSVMDYRSAVGNLTGARNTPPRLLKDVFATVEDISVSGRTASAKVRAGGFCRYSSIGTVLGTTWCCSSGSRIETVAGVQLQASGLFGGTWNVTVVSEEPEGRPSSVVSAYFRLLKEGTDQQVANLLTGSFKARWTTDQNARVGFRWRGRNAQDVKIVGEDVQGNSATVRVEFTGDGVRMAQALTLVRVGQVWRLGEK